MLISLGLKAFSGMTFYHFVGLTVVIRNRIVSLPDGSGVFFSIRGATKRASANLAKL